MDELLGLCDMVREVLSSTNSTKTPTNPASDRCEIRTLSRSTRNSKQKGKRDVEQLSHVDYVPANTNSARRVSVVHFFEDNDSSDQHETILQAEDTTQ